MDDWYDDCIPLLMNLNLLYSGKGGKVSDPAGATSKKVVLQSPSLVPGAKRIKMRHGPYSSMFL